MEDNCWTPVIPLDNSDLSTLTPPITHDVQATSSFKEYHRETCPIKLYNNSVSNRAGMETICSKPIALVPQRWQAQQNKSPLPLLAFPILLLLSNT